MIINYQVPALAAATGRWFARAMLRVTRRPDTLTNEPPRSAWQPDEMEYLVSARGFHIVWDEDLLTLAERLPLTVKNRRSVSYGRIAVADR